MFSSFIHAVTKVKNAFFCTVVWCSIVEMYHGFFIHSSTDGHLGCFQIILLKKFSELQEHTDRQLDKIRKAMHEQNDV